MREGKIVNSLLIPWFSKIRRLIIPNFHEMRERKLSILCPLNWIPWFSKMRRPIEVKLSHTANFIQFDAPSPEFAGERLYCVNIPSDCEPSIHHCHFTNSSLCGSCIYVHGEGARPHVSNCVISNANNVGIFVDNHAKVRSTVL